MENCEELGAFGHIFDQDWDNCVSVQQGLHSLKTIQLGKTQEANIAHFHRDLERFLRIGEVARS